jgi:glucokinase
LSLVHQFLTGEKLAPAQLEACAREDSETVQWMARFYGRVCRNYALQTLARGGVYIAGGVAPTPRSHHSGLPEFRSSDHGQVWKKSRFS